MQIPPKKEKRVEFRLVDGVKCKIEVEVEEPIKRLFLFGGARDVWWAMCEVALLLFYLRNFVPSIYPLSISWYFVFIIL